MTDFFVAAAGRAPADAPYETWGHMLGSINWDEVALLGELLTGVEYDHDDLEWSEPRGETQMGRVPEAFTTALEALADDAIVPLAAAWHQRLCAECGWRAGASHTLAQDIEGLRVEARKAVRTSGALWLRIEP